MRDQDQIVGLRARGHRLGHLETCLVALTDRLMLSEVKRHVHQRLSLLHRLGLDQRVSVPRPRISSEPRKIFSTGTSAILGGVRKDSKLQAACLVASSQQQLSAPSGDWPRASLMGIGALSRCVDRKETAPGRLFILLSRLHKQIIWLPATFCLFSILPSAYGGREHLLPSMLASACGNRLPLFTCNPPGWDR